MSLVRSKRSDSTQTDRPIGRTGATFQSFRIRNFRYWIAGQALAAIGFHTQAVAQALLVLDLTHSGVMLGAVTAAQFVPVLIVGPWAGLLSDRIDRRRLLLLAQSWTCVVALLLGVLVLTDRVTVAIVFVLSVLQGIAFALEQPARRTFTVELVPEPAVVNALSLHASLGPIGRIAGPALAGTLVAVIGIGWCFVVNGVLLLIVVATVLLLDRASMRPTDVVPRERGQIRSAFAYVWSDRRIAINLAIISVITTLSFNWNVTLVLLARALGGGSAAFATLSSLMGIGSLAGTLLVARFRRVDDRFLAWITIGYGLACAMLAVSRTLAIAGAASVLAGATFMALFAGMTANLQLRTTPTMRGRVSGIFVTCFVGGHAVGALIVGWMGESLGARQAILIGAGATAAVAIFALTVRRSSSELLAPAGVIKIDHAPRNV